MMRMSLVLWGILAGAVSMAYGAGAPTAGPGAEGGAGRAPNIFLILDDDLGYADLGCYGNAHVRTPNLDALAAQGVRFTDFHSNGPLCTPTRAALLTGRYQQRYGVDGVHGVGDLLPLSAVTIARRLRDDAGYATGIFGKWHLSGHDRSPEQYKGRMPGDFGFDEFRGFMSGIIDYASHLNANGKRDWWHNDRIVDEKGYASHLVVDHATRFIRAHRDRPFFVFLSFPDIHFPFMTPDDPPYFQPGEQYGFPRSDKEPENRRLGPHDGSPDLQRVVHRMIGEMDTGVGRVIDTLKACGLDRDTFVFFTSDNGGYIDYRGLNRGRISDMGPLRGQKSDLYEGGHRVPAIVWHPGRVPPGKVCDATALTFDLHPTFLDLAGLNPPPPGSADALDGVSLLPLLFHGKPIAERAVAWFCYQWRALRKGAWKLIQNGDRPPELYNLAEDIGETTNRLSEFSTLGNALHKELQALERDVKGRNK
jgi:arylsulfatase A